jgi:hypothetical protein
MWVFSAGPQYWVIENHWVISETYSDTQTLPPHNRFYAFVKPSTKQIQTPSKETTYKIKLVIVSELYYTFSLFCYGTFI